MESKITAVQAEMIRAACGVVAKKEFDHMLYVGDLPLPEDLVKAKSNARKKLVQAVATRARTTATWAIQVDVDDLEYSAFMLSSSANDSR